MSGETRVRRLLPTPGEEALDELYLDLDFPAPPPDRPHLYLDMVASADGGATVEGRTRDLGGEADARVLSRLRGWADAVLVGARTARLEGYGPPRTPPELRARRAADGMAASPRLVVVTASGQLDPQDRIFTDPQHHPLILATEATPRERLEALAAVAEVRTVGERRVDLRGALAELRRGGVARVCGEGGPTLNGELLAAGLVDELFLTVAAQLAPESPRRIVEGEVAGRPLELVELREHASELLLRYRLPRSGRGGW